MNEQHHSLQNPTSVACQPCSVVPCSLTPVWLFENPLGRKIMSPLLVTAGIICSISPCALIGHSASVVSSHWIEGTFAVNQSAGLFPSEFGMWSYLRPRWRGKCPIFDLNHQKRS